MRDPQKVAAAIHIAGAMRLALADQLEKCKATRFDEGVLAVELGRVFGAVLRWQDAPPSVMEHLVESVRSVYAGLKSGYTPDAEDAVRELCPESAGEAAIGSAAAGNPTVQ